MEIKKIANHANWVSRAFLFTTPVVALVLTTYYVATTPFQPAIWILGAVFYALTAMGITAGYHRLYSHRTYDASKFVKWFWALFGAAAFQHSILKWSMDHRLHHRFVDTDQDPYSINKGFFYAHMGWMLQEQTYPANASAYVRDLDSDPIVKFQHKYYLPLAIFMCFGLPTLIGWSLGSALGGFAIAACLRLVLVHHFTFFINSWCHTFGKKTYTNEHTAKDSFLMALATFGEGYHNFHHTFATDYRNGIRWYHWDPTKWSIQFFATFGLATNLKVTSPDLILSARLKMDETRLKETWSHRWEIAFEERVVQLRQRVFDAQIKWMTLKKEYLALKATYTEASRARLETLRAEVKMAHMEFKMSWAQWRTYNSSLLVAARV
jgi:stearoyl-CoA desaturase (delta-9 desaturase)